MVSASRVLLVGADEPSLAALHQLLTSAGHTVERARCAEDVGRRAEDEQVDVVLLAGDAMRDAQLREELTMLRARVGDAARRALVGRSPAIAQVRELVGRAASSRAPVLVTGEAGVGKDVIARMIHDLSERAARPFITVRCATADGNTLARELFGDGSRRMCAGALEEARGGTVVLEDATALPVALRARLARAATSRALESVGEHDTSSIARLVLVARDNRSATDAESIEHLRACFNAIVIDVPPLRERRSDIPQLVQHFRQSLAAASGCELAALSAEEMLPLLGREWPGNVRELEHWVERQPLGTRTVTPRVEPDGLRGVELGPSHATLEQLERAYIMHVLALESGHQSRTATRLGIDRRTLYRKLKQYRSV
jgi:DNA-binding NtrC family response regulator